MGDTTIKLLGLTKVSLRVYYWFLYDIIQIYIYTGVEKRFKATEEDQVQKKFKFLWLIKYENFLRLLHWTSLKKQFWSFFQQIIFNPYQQSPNIPCKINKEKNMV